MTEQQLFNTLKTINPGTKYFINRMFNKEQCSFLQGLAELVEEVNSKETAAEALSKQQMQDRISAIKEEVGAGRDIDNYIAEVFSLVREASKRTISLRHFNVQIIGGMALHKGKIAEMSTGEGKTLSATLPLCLNSLTGKGCHLVTVNDYLAKRDTQWMGPIFNYLGLTTGCIISYKESKGPSSATAFIFDPTYLPADSRFLNLRPALRQEAYKCDITYGVGSEFGFDYLRDNMAVRPEGQVQRELNYAIIDEVDSILIDEARTPLIISGPSEEAPQQYYSIDRLVRKLNRDNDFTVDEEGESLSLTDDGIRKCERLLGIQNLYDGSNTELVHHINQGLRAHTFFKRDKEYVVKDNKVVIVDSFTGRLMPGRRWSDGLHQAVEAKEGVAIESENQTLATVSFQNYFKLYNKISGMTGTAMTEGVEFKEIYKVDVLAIPANKDLKRTENIDEIYKTENEKFRAVVEEIKEVHKTDRPILVGTASIEKAEKLSRILTRANLAHQVLHGKNHEAEAAIIAQAGKPKAITLATQMAGRGVDIILGGNPEILAREETIKQIWSRKKRSEGNKKTGDYSALVNSIEEHYSSNIQKIEEKYNPNIEDLRRQLDEKEKIFSATDKKVRDLFENEIFRRNSDSGYAKFESKLLRLREIHSEATEALNAAQLEFKDKPERLKELIKTAGSTHREYLSFKNSLKNRFNITTYEDIEELRNKLTEILNSGTENPVEFKNNISGTLEQYTGAISYYHTILQKTFPQAYDNEAQIKKAAKKIEGYLQFLQHFYEKLQQKEGDIRAIVEEFNKKEGQLHSEYLNRREDIEHCILQSLSDDDYTKLENEYKELNSLYEKEMSDRDKELRQAREEYELERLNCEEEWTKAREELEKTPEEFKETFQELLDKYQKPWIAEHEKITQLGGLHVIGSERYESRRIDNQLKGRAGRQGDPGSSKFYLSLEDDLLRIFGSEKMAGIMSHLPEGETIAHPLINKMINNAQKKVEGRNFEIRKQLLEFDNVMDEQRKVIYSIRQDILKENNIDSYLEDFFFEIIEEDIEEHMSLKLKPFLWNTENFQQGFFNTFNIQLDLPSPEEITNSVIWRDSLKEKLVKQTKEEYYRKKEEIGPYLAEVQKIIMLQVIDNRWKSHLRVIDELRDGINLRAYAQHDPLLSYKHEGYQTFQVMLSSIKKEIVSYLFKIQVSETGIKAMPRQKRPSGVSYTHQPVEQFEGQQNSATARDNDMPPIDMNRRGAESGLQQPYVKDKKVGRNEPCPCGSGKKYKKCCGQDV